MKELKEAVKVLMHEETNYERYFSTPEKAAAQMARSSFPNCAYCKEFKPEYTTVSVLPMTISNGKTVTTIMVPYTIHYPDRWVIYIKAYDEETRKWITEDFYVSEEVYDSVNIGDYFVFDEDMGTRDEPYTKQESE